MKDLHEDNLFGSMRERLSRYEESPSEALWDKIASRKRERVWPLLLEPVGIVMIGILLFNNVDNVTSVTDEKIVNATESKASIKATQEHQTVFNTNAHINTNTKITTSKPISQTTLIVTQEIPARRSSPVDLPSTLDRRQSTFAPSIDSLEVGSPIVRKDSASAKKPDEVIPPYKKPKSRFQFFLSITPSLSFQKMTPSANDQLIVQGFASRSPMSMKRFGFSIDAGFQRDINKYFGYYGGLTFYHQNQELTYQYYNKDAQVTRVGDEWVFEIIRTQQTRTFDYTMNNLGARAGMLVTLKGEKLKHKFGAGLVYTHSMNSSNSYLAYQLSYRNEVKVNDHMSWFVEPTFIYSFISKEKLDEPFKLNPYRAGITAGLLYRF